MSKKYRMLVFMCIAMMLGYLPWFNFSAVSSYISEDLNLSIESLGIILSSFQAGYVIMVIFTGWLADRIGRKKVVAWATLFTGIFSTMFAFLANDFTSIFILRLLTGLCAGAIYAPGMVLVMEWFPPSERGKAIGIYTGALNFAFAGGYFIAAPLAAVYHWRIGILVTSIPALIAAAIIFFLVKENKNKHEEIAPEVSPTIAQSLDKKESKSSFLSKKRLGPILVTTGYMGHMWELYAFQGWIGPFLMASAYAVGYSMSEAVLIGGQLAAMIILLGAVSVSLIGAAADKFGREKLAIIAALCSLCAELVIGFFYGHTLSVVTVIAIWIGFWGVADSGIYKVLLSNMVKGEKAATALGIQSAAGYSMTILSPYLFGKLLSMANNGVVEPIFAREWGSPFIILGLGAMVAPLSISLFKRLRD